MNTIYTIGYAGFNITEFINELKKHNITCVIDVRSKPYSSYHKDYNMNNLIKTLNSNSIHYRNYTNGFGAWQRDERFFSKLSENEMYLDFEKFRESDVFKEDFEKVMQGVELNYTFAFMCSEIDPARCHRNIMVAKAFKDKGFNVLNIVPTKKGSMIDESNLETIIMKKYKTKDLNEAYKKANMEVAYKIKI